MTAWDFSGKRVLVTGGASGIGAAVVEAFAAAGASVAIHYRSSAESATAMVDRLRGAGVEAVALQADLARWDDAERLAVDAVRQLGPIDVLVNNAGTMVGRRGIGEMDRDYVQAVVDVNLLSTVACSRAVVPDMIERRSGSVVNVTSVAARTGGGGGATIYAATKAAVSTFTRGLAREVAKHCVRVNALAPGIVVTPFQDQYTPRELFESLVATVPIGRAASPVEMTGPVLFLASDELAGYVTGHVLEVNGGMYSP
jgi:3-oxoacyl-[acyl-carrier protein] reductase